MTSALAPPCSGPFSVATPTTTVEWMPVSVAAATPAAARSRGREIAERIAKHSPQAVARSKQAVWESLDVGYHEALERGWRSIQEHWAHPDFEEGPRAFVEGREPRWNPDPLARRAGEEPLDD